ncbi:MAG: Gfo/Idh/MocA family oxidoreductase [Vicinamibacterales bacterium]
MTPNKVRWGVLGVARIATQKVIPAMQRGEWSEVVAIASRDGRKADQAAVTLGLTRSYASYDALLADPDIEAIYNPLPNHLHVPWTKRAAEAGKHVLCEKPIAMNAAEARTLLDVRDRTGVQIQEAFMVRVNPQWIRTVEEVRKGRIGELRAVTGVFSYFNDDPANIRNKVEWGGGGLMDIGCYLINTARMIFGREPQRVAGAMDRDPRNGTDIVTSLALDFAAGQASGVCSTQMVAAQRVNVFGTRGRIEVEIPFNAPPDRPNRLFIDDGSTLGRAQVTIELPVCNQYTIQGDLFSQAVRGLIPLPYPLEDSILNMRVIDAVFRAAESGRWEVP